LFPKAKFITGKSTSFGFYFDFYLEEIREEHFSLIEETMANLVEKTELKTFHMTSQNAKDFLKYHSLQSRIEELEGRPFVDVVQINNFVFFPKEKISNTEDLKVKGLLNFKIFQIEKIARSVRVYGALFEDSKELKNFLKMQKNYSSLCLKIAEDMGLFYQEGSLQKGVWTEKGRTLKKVLLNFLTKELQKENFSFIETTSLFDAIALLQKKEKRALPIKIAEVKQTTRSDEYESKDPVKDFFLLNNIFILLEYVLCEKELILKEIISSLKFFLKILKIFNFSYQVLFTVAAAKKNDDFAREVLKRALKECDIEYLKLDGEDTKIEFLVEDKRRWQHEGPFLEVEVLKDKKNLLKRSTFRVLEDLIALLLEKTEGYLPFSLNPEQVRIIVLNEDCLGYSEEIKDICERNGFRAIIDRSEDAINVKIHQAMRAKVSFVAVVGEKEKKSRSVVLRNQNGMEEMDLTSFLTKLKNALN
jgi:threonyl-tRNA synthetase